MPFSITSLPIIGAELSLSCACIGADVGAGVGSGLSSVGAGVGASVGAMLVQVLEPALASVGAGAVCVGAGVGASVGVTLVLMLVPVSVQDLVPVLEPALALVSFLLHYFCRILKAQIVLPHSIPLSST